MAGSPETAEQDRRARATAILIACLLALTVVGIPIVLLIGDGMRPEREIDGRYAIALGRDCTGLAIDLNQSGQFATLTRPDGRQIGRLRIREGEISGELTCSDDRVRPLAARVRGRVLSGTLGAGELRGLRVREFEEGEREPATPASVEGSYLLSPQSACLGRSFVLEGSGRPVLEAGEERYPLSFRQGELSGPIRCLDGRAATLSGVATGDRLELEIERVAPPAGEQRIEQAIAERDRSLGERTAAFFLAVAVVLAAARLVGSAAVRLGQPRVMGEIVAGILLGPTLLGELAPTLQAQIFSADVLPALGVVASLGLVIYMFVIGVEIDAGAMRRRGRGVAVAAVAGFTAPLLLGSAAALFVYELLAPETDFAPFALFLGLAMSITAFPVLARILEERGMLTGAIGATALTAAAIDDLAAWILITLAAALAVAGSAAEVLPTLGLTAVFAAVLVGVVRPLLQHAALSHERSPATGWVALVLGMILLAAYVTEEIGIAFIIGALALGAVMPKGTRLTAELRNGSEGLVTLLLLPLFFAYTGLQTDVSGLGAPELWLLAAVLLAIAIAGKLGAVTLAARVAGMGWRRAAMLGTMMNTRGLTELIVLNLALELGVISEALFTALVLMALITTFMAGPLLRALDPSGAHGRAS